MKVNTYKKIDVATASFPVELNINSTVSLYKFSGTKTLSTNVAVSPTAGTPRQGTTVVIDMDCAITPGAYTFTVFGTAVPTSMLSRKLRIWCDYINSAWTVLILPSVDELHFIGTQLLATDIMDETTIEYHSGTEKFRVKDSGISAAKLATDAVETAKIKQSAVTLAKLQDITRGSIIIGGASDAPTTLDAKASGQIVIGDGTDVKSVAVSGDVTITPAGAVAIGANKVLSAMIKAGELVNAHINAAAGIVFTKMAALTASKIPVLNASGFIEAGTVDASKLGYIDVTPGTSGANKSVVLGATGKIDTIDITALTLNGTAITATPAEINYLSGVTGNVQTQIDAGIAKISQTNIIVDTTPVAANLKSLYFADTTTAGGALVLTLPLASTVTIGTPVRLVRIGANAASFAVQGGDSIFPTTSLTVDAGTIACSGDGKGVDVICISATAWQCIRKD